MRIRQGSAIVVAAATAVALAGCTGGGGGGADGGSDDLTGTITFQTWSLKNEKFTPYFEQLIDDFEAEHEGATIEWVDQPGDGYEDKVLQQAESGELPDVINLPPEFAYSLSKAGQLADLTDTDAFGDYVEGGLEAYTFDEVADDDGTYGYPWYLGTDVNYWNTARLAEGGVDAPPATFDEFLADAKTLGEAGIPTLSGLPGVASLLSFSSPEDDLAPMYDADSKEFVFNTPEAAAIVDEYAELYEVGAVDPAALQGADAGNVNQFNTGNVAWTTAGPNYIVKDVAVNAPSILDSVTATPSFGVPPLFVQGISVSANSEHSALATAFAAYATNNENQVAFVKIAEGFYPGTKEANDDPTSFAIQSDNAKQAEATEVAAEQMATAQSLQPPVWTDDMNTYSKQQIALAVKGEITGQEALDASVDYANSNL